MIVSASYRTDIPAFYGEWFMRRVEAGSCTVRNPYGRPYTVRLDREAVSGFVFWTRNAGPFVPALRRLASAGYPFVVQYTINDYPRVLEASVIDHRRAAGHAHEIAREFGPRVVVWRYDPVIVTNETPLSSHVERLARLGETLAGAVDEVVVSFASFYRKTRRNLDRTRKSAGLAWDDPPSGRKRELIDRLARIAGEFGIEATVCAQPELAAGEAGEASCIDARRLGDVAGAPIAARLKGNRPGCACHEARDIGAYDTCPHGCIYCYAVSSPRAAKARHARHDPDRPSLG